MATNPVDQRVIERVNPVSGVKEQLPALHKAWCEEINFLPFSPPSHPSSPEWSQLMEAIDSDLHLLLTLPHHRFWSQAIHDQSLHLLLDSYLQHAPRPYEDSWNLSHSERELLRNVHRRVFLVLLRLSTHKESAEHFLSAEAFAENIYKHYLFDIPRIMDICSVYGTSNAQLVSKMVDNIFNKEIRYRMDLRLSLDHIKKLLSGIVRKCGDVGGAHSDSSDGESSEGDDDTTLRLDSASTLSQDNLVSTVSHIADITHSLLSLLNIYPSAASIFWGKEFAVRLIKFYRSVVPNLQRQVRNFIGENGRVVKQLLRVAKKNIPSIVNNLLINSGDSEVQLDQILNVVTTLTGAKPFLREFQKHFDLKECLTNVAKHHPNLDSTQLTYLLSPVTDAATPTAATPMAACDTDQPPVEYIQELFPELEQDFIEACLKEYHGNVESVLSALLDGTLPSYLVMKRSLESVASSQQQQQSEPSLVQSEEASVLDQRVSVFDHDGFDVFHGGVDLTKVHIGKRHQSAKSVLSDRSHVSLMKNSGLDYVYEDEYDDTYDSHNVGAVDHDSADELFTVKRLNQKGLHHSRYVAKDDESDSDDEEEEEGEKEPVVPFGAPVRILQRPEQQGQQGGRGGKRRGGDGHSAGKQDGEKGKNPAPQNTAKLYYLKEKNKGSRANHNRRMLADKKRNKGLF